MSFNPIATESIVDWLASRLTDERLTHVLGVRDTALQWGALLEVSADDLHRLELASLLHDSAKQWPADTLKHYLDKAGYDWQPVDFISPAVWHAWAGALIATAEWSITDPSVLNAIRFHTTGRAGMGLIERILFVSDKIEPVTRDAALVDGWAQEVQVLSDNLPEGGTALQQLDNWVKVLLGNNLAYLTRKGLPIHPDTVKAWNDQLLPCHQRKNPVLYNHFTPTVTQLEDHAIVSL